MPRHIWVKTIQLNTKRTSKADDTIAEEIENANVVIPRAMILTVFINGLTGFGMLIAFCFCMGPLDEVLGNEFPYPFMIVLANITDSMIATTILVSLCRLEKNMSSASINAITDCHHHRNRYLRIDWSYGVSIAYVVGFCSRRRRPSFTLRITHRASHSTTIVFNRDYGYHLHFARSHSIGEYHCFLRTYWTNGCWILLRLHDLGMRNALAAADNTFRKHCMGAISPWKVWCTNHTAGLTLQLYWVVF